MMKELITIKDLHIGYKKSGKDRAIAGPINLSLKAGEFVCMIGPNGSGKTTLLKTLAGVQKPLEGIVEIHYKNITDFQPTDLAKSLSVVLTDRISVGNLDVYELVSLGRYPYTNWLGGLSREDKQIIDHALEITHTKIFENRQVGELSDGETQKVMIARALAQDTEIILLDEPTAHLDLPNRIEIFQLLRRLAKETKKAILLSTHELDLALQSADKIWLVKSSQKEERKNEILCGAPEDLILNGSFEKAFESRGLCFDKMTGRFKLQTELCFSVNLTGPEVQVFWTSRALEREGYDIDNSYLSEIKIAIDKKGRIWEGKIFDKAFSVTSIEELLETLRNTKKDLNYISENINSTKNNIMNGP